MPAQPTQPVSLETIADLTLADPGLLANVSDADIQGGADAARTMNEVIETAIGATGVNEDGQLSVRDLYTLSRHIRSDNALYQTFLVAHGDDEGNVETGFHLVQGDGGTYRFQGRDFIDTVADAIYHVGFRIVDGRFQNEDGNQNETVADVAGWMNYFVNGENRVYGTNAGETLYSGDYSDALRDAANEIFEAGGGNDKVWAGDGDDQVFAGAGHDVSGGGNGNDHLVGEGGHDKLWGEDGDDTLEGGQGHDTIGGGAGDDSAQGGNGRDKLWGNDGDDMLWGGAHNDTLGGDQGDDSLWGEGGRDKIWGGDGADVIDAGAGNDTAGGGNGDDVITLGAGRDIGYGDGGDDLINAGAGHDTVWAHWGDDTVLGDGGNDKIGGGDGSDSLSGGDGRDTLWGDNDEDTLDGGAGRDQITGGNGVDIMIGGTGGDVLQDWEAGDNADVFVFAPGDSGLSNAATDVILGYNSGIDLIDLSAFGGLEFVETEAFSGSRAEVRFDGDYVQIDSDGDGRADERIELRWVSSVVESDFIL